MVFRKECFMCPMLWPSLVTACMCPQLTGRERSLTGLQRAVWDGDVARVRAVTAKSQAGLLACDREGRSLLHLAAARGHRDMAELLLKRRLPTDGADGDGNTPLIKVRSRAGGRCGAARMVREWVWYESRGPAYHTVPEGLRTIG